MVELRGSSAVSGGLDRFQQLDDDDAVDDDDVAVDDDEAVDDDDAVDHAVDDDADRAVAAVFESCAAAVHPISQ